MNFFCNNNVNANMTSLKGHFRARFIDIVAVFGEPTESDGYKVSGEWKFMGDDGRVFTLYDWKSTELYDDGLPSVADFRKSTKAVRFNIGGHGSCVDFVVWLETKVAGMGVM